MLKRTRKSDWAARVVLNPHVRFRIGDDAAIEGGIIVDEMDEHGCTPLASTHTTPGALCASINYYRDARLGS